jgi:hypothetical protein
VLLTVLERAEDVTIKKAKKLSGTQRDITETQRDTTGTQRDIRGTQRNMTET